MAGKDETKNRQKNSSKRDGHCPASFWCCAAAVGGDSRRACRREPYSRHQLSLVAVPPSAADIAAILNTARLPQREAGLWPAINTSGVGSGNFPGDEQLSPSDITLPDLFVSYSRLPEVTREVCER